MNGIFLVLCFGIISFYYKVSERTFYYPKDSSVVWKDYHHTFGRKQLLSVYGQFGVVLYINLLCFSYIAK